MVASRESKRGDINVIQIGVQRSAVISALGEPDNYSAIEGGGYDDRYKLDPDAHHWALKFLQEYSTWQVMFLRFSYRTYLYSS